MNIKCLLTTVVLLFFLISFCSAQTLHLDLNKSRMKARQALAFCRAHHYDTRYVMLIDMGLPSGLKRMLIWDLGKNDTLLTGLVSHGCGNGPWSGVWSKDKPVFSNALNSHCTSLGKYVIKGRGYSQWGIHVKYYLTGLEKSNSNAAKRQVVLHSWNAVPQNEVYPAGIPEGWGCPAVSNQTMALADKFLRTQKLPVLLWIYN